MQKWNKGVPSLLKPLKYILDTQQILVDQKTDSIDKENWFNR